MVVLKLLLGEKKMKRYISGEVCLYCALADDVVFLSYKWENVSMLGGHGYAIHSACCSKYAECGCKHYGLANECKSIFKQAERIIRNDRTL